MSTDDLFSEKRKERRFPINSEVFMSLDSGKVLKGICSNISGSGMLVQSPVSIKVGSNLRLDIREGRIDFTADATVVRLEKQDGHYLLGLKTNKNFE